MKNSNTKMKWKKIEIIIYVVYIANFLMIRIEFGDRLLMLIHLDDEYFFRQFCIQNKKK